MATQAQVAGHLDLTRQAVSDLLQRNILPNADKGQLDLDACRVAYVRHLRDQASQRSGGSDNLAKWRTELAREKAIEARRANELAARKIIPMEQAILARQEAIGHARAKLLGIPTKAAPILAAIGDKPQVIKERLTELIHECLDELSRTSFVAGGDSIDGSDDQRPREDGGRGGNGSGADLGTAAETDGQRVG